MRKKFLAAAAALSAFALALTGCGGSGGGASSSGGAVHAPDGGVLDQSGPNRIDQGLLTEFEAANPGIKVQLVSPPTEQADQKIQQMLQSGSGVDVLEVRDLTVGPFSNNGWLYDMAGDLKGWDGLDKLTDQAKKSTIDADGQSYFIPYGFYGLSLFYRTDLVKDAGFAGARRAGTT